MFWVARTLQRDSHKMSSLSDAQICSLHAAQFLAKRDKNTLSNCTHLFTVRSQIVGFSSELAYPKSRSPSCFEVYQLDNSALNGCIHRTFDRRPLSGDQKHRIGVEYGTMINSRNPLLTSICLFSPFILPIRKKCASSCPSCCLLNLTFFD